MYAIFVDGGRQFRVEEGQEVDVDYRDMAAGSEIQFDNVLAVGAGAELKVGAPRVEGAAMVANVVGLEMGDKLTVQKYRRRKNSRRRNGHRQMYTRVKVNKIVS